MACGGSGINDKTETNQIEETLLLDVPIKTNFSYEGYGWKSIEHGHVELVGENIVSASQIWDGCEGSSGQSQCYDTRMMSSAVLAPQNYETWRGSVISNVSEARDPNSTDGRYRDYNFNMLNYYRAFPKKLSSELV